MVSKYKCQEPLPLLRTDENNIHPFIWKIYYHCFFCNLLRSFIEGGGCDPGNPGGPIGGWVEGPKGSEPPMPPEEACCKRSTMELAAVLSAGEIGAKKWLESRADMAEGITMLGSLAVISVEEI